ncbi:hypothetical protein MPTK2_3g00470 [Marchantia polymorpha subsp. ruderalis]
MTGRGGVLPSQPEFAKWTDDAGELAGPSTDRSRGRFAEAGSRDDPVRTSTAVIVAREIGSHRTTTTTAGPLQTFTARTETRLPLQCSRSTPPLRIDSRLTRTDGHRSSDRPPARPTDRLTALQRVGSSLTNVTVTGSNEGRQRARPNRVRPCLRSMFVEPGPGKRCPDLSPPCPAGCNFRPRRRGKNKLDDRCASPPARRPAGRRQAKRPRASARNGRLSVSDAERAGRRLAVKPGRSVSGSVRAGARGRGGRSRGPGSRQREREKEREEPSGARGGAGRERGPMSESRSSSKRSSAGAAAAALRLRRLSFWRAGAKASKFGCSIIFPTLEEEQGGGGGGGVERASVVDKPDHARSAARSAGLDFFVVVGRGDGDEGDDLRAR